ncbi:FAD-dependent oxidoreductase [Nocardia sp. R16R-3T]
MRSLWLNDAEVPARLRLTPGLQFDTVVIGAGITGLVTALLLAQSGVDVAVLESKRVGEGTTGASNAKVSLLQGIRAQRIRARHGRSAVTDYVEANREGQQWLLHYCAEHSVPIQRVPALTYAQKKSEISAVRREYEATRAAGLATTLVEELDVPFPTHGAVRLDDQAQLDPMALLASLAADIEARGAPIFESSRAKGVHSGKHDQLVIETEHGDIVARTAILATGTPILDRGGFFARLTAERSYLSAFRVTEHIPHEMFISAGEPTRSLRYTPGTDGTEVLLVGGNGHVVGRTNTASRRVEDLITWTRRYFPAAEPLQSWAAQDYHPVDELPYVGPLLPGQNHILLATGYAKWGLTNSIAAAFALAGRINGKPPRWADTFASWRPSELKSLPAAVFANTSVAQQLSLGWLRMLGTGIGDVPAEGHGRVERHGLRPTAVCTVDRTTTEVSAVCPHLGGIVSWNDAEQSWDCPLHGSRFAADGTLLEGPATDSLTPIFGPIPQG